ncbi:rho GTPase-activating protein 30 isoform X2 [Scleropages formosus]|uniref:rho GTPase-activating protein 30 isoform X2 n=1 Tax=Scleropages formosus TaxID=113540 RepID=UPI00087878AB|nr:rho GTPase-activating protein 30-like isoform X2 [Scleropages formosus]
MRRGRKRGGNKEKVFGCDLLEHLSASSQEIPLVLRCCSEFIEEHGIVDGIYRLSGVSSNTVKLRSEFEGEGYPDLNKDVYLQDIHCVSSLCKAYFRELPNPLLTYQLYDKFAEAVAIHLEEERLVKIKEVLKELPRPHYRTLEFLMRHLVRMAAHSAQTNMHARNLAIVWAPNLLRSKDIEATGLNGTAAFMEVRVQSVVVEFILTHVSQLFSEPGHVSERRQSLPSPTPCNHDDKSKEANAFQFLGTISPGDGPPPMRPYHAIIEGTDKRKGSLKGKKWTSIFNLGGRLSDPKKKSKYPRKEKEKTSLRPAKSMDSLSTISSSQSGPRQRPPACQLSLANQPPPCLSGGGEAGAIGGSMGGIGSSYAVTYRRGGGASVSVVSGTGTPGTYSRLDSGGVADAQHPQPKSPAMSSKAERRAGMHISGPFSVTVPLHITSGLALGVLQAAPGERGEELLQKGEDRERDRKENTGDKAEQEDMRVLTAEGKEAEAEAGSDGSDGGTEEEQEEEEEEQEEDEEEEAALKKKEEERRNSEGVGQLAGHIGQEHKLAEERDVSVHGLPVKETQAEVATGEDTKKTNGDSATEGLAQHDEALRTREDQGEDKEEGDYMEMKGVQPQHEDSQEFPLDFQDTFGFLDLIDSSNFNQINEFSVEPPCYDMEEEEESAEQEAEEKKMSFSHQQWEQSSPGVEDVALMADTNAQSSQILSPKTFDLHNKACKSHSLPYKSALHNPHTDFSDDDVDEEDDQDEDDSDDEEDALYYSLPAGIQLSVMKESEADTRSDEAPGTTQVDNEGKEESALFQALKSEQNEAEECTNKGSGESWYTADPEHASKNSNGHDQWVRMNNEEEKDCADAPSCSSTNREDHTAAPRHGEGNDPQTNLVQTDPESEVKSERDFSEGHHGEQICADTCSADSVCGTNLGGEAVSSGVTLPDSPWEPDESHLVNYSPPVCLLNPCEINPDNDGLANDSEDVEAVVSMMEGSVFSSRNSEELSEICTERGEQGENTANRDTAGEQMSDQQTEDSVQQEEDNEEHRPVDPSVCKDMDVSGTREADGIPEESKTEEPSSEESPIEGSMSDMNKEEVEKELKGEHELDKGPIRSKHAERIDTHILQQDESSEEGASDKVELNEDGDENEGNELGMGTGLGRTTPSQPKVQHVKPVPVVPPKTELSKLAALNLRQQLQQRGTERGKEGEWHKDRDKEGQDDGDRERVEGEKEGDKEKNRNSAISMCFDEAVARATERREREKEEREQEREKERGTDEQVKQRGNDSREKNRE